MAIAEVIGGSRQRLRRIALDVDHFLHLGDYLDHAAVGSDYPVAAAHHHAARQHDRDGLSRDEARELAALLPSVEGQPQLAAHARAVSRAGPEWKARADLDHGSEEEIALRH